MAEIVGRVFLAIIDSLIELLCERTGRIILRFFGVRKPTYISSVLLGITVWTIAACLLVGYLRSY